MYTHVFCDGVLRHLFFPCPRQFPANSFFSSFWCGLPFSTPSSWTRLESSPQVREPLLCWMVLLLLQIYFINFFPHSPRSENAKHFLRRPSCRHFLPCNFPSLGSPSYFPLSPLQFPFPSLSFSLKLSITFIRDDH